MKNKILAANAHFTSEVELLLKELEPFGDARLNQKPADGGWSALQTLHHLILVEENSLAYVQKKLSFNPEFERPGFKTWGRSLLLRWSLQSPIKFKAPKSAGIEKIPENSTLAETRTKWLEIRHSWEETFEQMPVELLEKAVYKHPRAGRISWLQMLDFFYAHFARHRKQVRKAVS